MQTIPDKKEDPFRMTEWKVKLFVRMTPSPKGIPMEDKGELSFA